jgi:hypothetical protein
MELVVVDVVVVVVVDAADAVDAVVVVVVDVAVLAADGIIDFVAAYKVAVSNRIQIYCWHC